ncbi:hypothetical protein [Rhizobium leguminosarum]|uniref:hypothetical protein n=1 Tax=Rhizobium leguminosarum TaxID=384 RepID=UPI00104009DB|nr:hypothetical protein [Rhizobium leguminosarum]TBZ12190.1 hypothetical protein E0H33_20540 [Rhizobium leguminosarum bv. viciae]
MAAQDDARENQLVDLFNLERPAARARHGVDAILELDGHTLEFELKSVTTKKPSMSTVRDLGRDHIEKWSGKHWIVAFYADGALKHCHYLSPDDMAPWIDKIWQYIKADFDISDAAPKMASLETLHQVLGAKEIYSLDDAKKLHKKQYSNERYFKLCDVPGGYSPERMLQIFQDRMGYLLRRGSTLNNPHVSASYFEAFPAITKNHAIELRTRVKRWLELKNV